jgi:hypothetical protein
MTRTLLLAAAALTLLATVASGCGSSGSEDEGVAAIDTDTSSSADGAASTTPQQTDEDPQEAALKWARCMRENGVDVPDPQFDSSGRGRVEFRAGSRAAAGNEDEFRKATEKCGTPFGNAGPPQLSDEERQELQDSLLEFAQCMREHGIDMPDPKLGSGGGVFSIGPGGGGGIDLDDPDFRKAQEACGSILQDARGRVGAAREQG